MMNDSRSLFFTGTLMLLCAVYLHGCAASSKLSRQEREIRQALSADAILSVDSAPPEAPPQRVASFRIASQGRKAIQEGRLQDAEDALEKALALDMRNPFCYYYLAEIREKEGKIKQALILLDQAIILFQGNRFWLSEAYARKGACWEGLPDHEKARQAYQKALKYNPWNQTSLTRNRELEKHL